MGLVTPDPATGALAVSPDWTFQHRAEIVRALDGHVAAMAGDTLTLDFGSLRFIDSAGIADLLQLHRKLRDANRKLVIRRPTEAVRKIMNLVSLGRFVRIEP